MTSAAQEFVDNPSSAFNRLTRDQLIVVAVLFRIELTSSEKWLKHTVRSVLLPFLVERKILSPVDLTESILLKKLLVREKKINNQSKNI